MINKGFCRATKDKIRRGSFAIRTHNEQIDLMLSDIGQNGVIRSPSQVHFRRLYSISANVLSQSVEQLLCAIRIVVDI